MEGRTLGHIAALFTMLVWGATFVSTKVLFDYMSPLDILLARTVLGFLALCLIRPRILRLNQRSHELLFAAAGFTGAFCYYLAENTALEFASTSFVSVAVSTAPLFTALLGFVVLKEKGFGIRFVVGFAVAITGIALISFQGGEAYASAPGIALCLAAAASWAIYSVIVERLSELGYETIAATKRIFAWGLVFMIATHFIRGGAFPLEAFAEPIVLGNLTFLGVLASAACFVTWGYSVKHLGTASASAYIYLQAPMSVVWAIVLLNDPINGTIALGIVLVLAGLALSEEYDRILREQFQRSKKHQG